MPNLSASVQPRLGTTIVAQLGHPIRSATFGARLLGCSSADVGTDFGGTLLALSTVYVTLAVPGTGQRLRIAMPSATTLRGRACTCGRC